MDIISYVVSYFISYVKTLMTWENDLWVFDWIWDWFNNLAQTFAKVWDRIAYVIWDAFSSIRNAFMQTIPWKICGFIWDIVMFLLYGIRSILLLLWNLIYSILNWFVEMFTQLNSTFYDLSYFMWSSTSILISLFSLALLIIWFWFLLRFFTWKYFYNRHKK